ncbi:hypothetical protein ACH5RR_008680 [Cinchona calisaya]|uniref:Reverse transcriptase domain-containing protein n=1 Tax=Cinchona calisaya TaxID=153742 RepID=A0ABD3ADY0_9GENT
MDFLDYGICYFVTYASKVNGNISRFVRPSRGIRQEDPLYPYLFPLCSNGLSSLLSQAVIRKDITSVKISRCCPRDSCLLFANDTLLFHKATVKESQNIFSILQNYEACSG